MKHPQFRGNEAEVRRRFGGRQGIGRPSIENIAVLLMYFPFLQIYVVNKMCFFGGNEAEVRQRFGGRQGIGHPSFEYIAVLLKYFPSLQIYVVNKTLQCP